jgi:hypothetical protein
MNAKIHPPMTGMRRRDHSPGGHEAGAVAVVVTLGPCPRIFMADIHAAGRAAGRGRREGGKKAFVWLVRQQGWRGPTLILLTEAEWTR